VADVCGTEGKALSDRREQRTLVILTVTWLKIFWIAGESGVDGEKFIIFANSLLLFGAGYVGRKCVIVWVVVEETGD